MIYLVYYLDAKGELANIRVDAETREDARLLSRIPERRIQYVREDLIGRLSQLLEETGPPAKNQAVFMQTLSSALSTGKTVRQAISTMLEEAKWIKFDETELEHCEELSDYLKLFKFDKNAILLAETASRTGKYAEALQRASKYLLDQEKAKNEVAGEVRTGITYITLGTLFFILVPIFIGSSLTDMQIGGASVFKPNEVTTVLVAWGNFLSNFWIYPLIASPVVFWYRQDIWKAIRGLPLLSTINQKNKLDRAVRFIGAYGMLHEVGMVDSEAVLSLLQASKGEDAEIYKAMYAKLATSEDLGNTFEKTDWPLALRETMGVFGDVEESEQAKILQALLDSLHIEHLHFSRSVSKSLSRIGFFMMVSCVLAAVIGFYLPIVAGASSGAML